MIVVTGAAGFIGSHVAKLASLKDGKLCLVDDLDAFKNNDYVSDLIRKSGTETISTLDFPDQLPRLQDVSAIIHMGAITNTGERDVQKLNLYNTDYTKKLWDYCSQKQIPLLYASSAATYGDGTQGFSDSHDSLAKLKPLNPYGESKNHFDLWALKQTKTPRGWWGVKFFNVFGSHEDHKSRMASTVWHGFHEIQETGKMTLFRSHNPKYKDGEQERDFVYIKDVLSMLDFILEKNPPSGIYNIGTGKASKYIEVAQSLFEALQKPLSIQWVDTPEAFRGGYQYHTQADMTKLQKAGYAKPMTPLKNAIADYVSGYLLKKN